VDLLEALLLAACFAVIVIPVSSFQIPHFEVRKSNFYPLLYSENAFDFPSPTEQEEIANFGKWILSIGDGNDASDENGEMKVEIPEDLLISDTTNPLMSLIDFVYPDLNDNLGDPLFFQEKGILAPTLDSVEHVNEYMMSLIPGE